MSEDDQTESETKKPRTRGTKPTDRTAAAVGGAADPDNDGDGARGGMWGGGQRQMPWDRGQQGGGMPWGQPQGAPNGNTGIVGPHQGGHPAFQWGGQGQGGGMPNWQALAQQFMQRFQGNPMMQRLGMTGQGMRPPGQAPAAPPQAPQQGMQPGAAQGGPLQGRIQQLAQMFGQRQQPGGITGGPGQGPTY